ncbi:MAG: hypothetical protein LBK07_09315 [Tannerella sp.]|jgi:tellurite resistance protein|nr:hypothetical protein [Tannerella sp.]
MGKTSEITTDIIEMTDEELSTLESLAACMDGNTTPEESRAMEAMIDADEQLRDTVETVAFMEQHEAAIESVYSDDDYREKRELFNRILDLALAGAAAAGRAGTAAAPDTGGGTTLAEAGEFQDNVQIS